MFSSFASPWVTRFFASIPEPIDGNGLVGTPVPRFPAPSPSGRFEETRYDLNQGDWLSGAGQDKFDTIRS
jgi:hypothetical protein